MHAAFLTSFCALALLLVSARAAPLPWDTSASTGMGGNAAGGSVSNSPTIISAFSNNAGNGGNASSGDALAKDASRKDSPGSSNVSEDSPADGGLIDILGLTGDAAQGDSENKIL
ncbi:hypothetical protein MVEN_01900500 [Mycena venus]|uniref:Uncharacterized protein n=1 Tax=Mycena venus TaxID=2733690 RepID=A0A8H7CLL3_9AGAR|nr:hypothetical protein MVEN_01900500 [Mycena venus]